MKPEFERLISDVVSSDDTRAESLELCLAAARHERASRRVRRMTAAVLFLFLAAGLLLPPRSGPSRKAVAQAVAPEVIPGTQIEVIGDKQLLDLFKDHPVALVGPPGRQQLLLLDQEPAQ